MPNSSRGHRENTDFVKRIQKKQNFCKILKKKRKNADFIKKLQKDCRFCEKIVKNHQIRQKLTEKEHKIRQKIAKRTQFV